MSPRRTRPLSERIWLRIDKRGPSDCWPWLGATNKGPKTRGGPYGKIGAGGRRGKVLAVHRVVYELEIGPIPEGFQIDHTCGSPLCCNPAHLEAVTPLTNNARSGSPTSINTRKDQCPQRHEYDEQNTGYRVDRRSGRQTRYCRACARLAQAANRQRGLTYPQWRAEFHAAQDS